MFQLLVKFIFFIISKIADLIFSPIIAILTAALPDLSLLIENVKGFLSTYVFDTLKFVKMFMINTLAFPLELLSFLISVFTILITVYVSMHLYKGILALYQKLKP